MLLHFFFFICSVFSFLIVVCKNSLLTNNPFVLPIECIQGIQMIPATPALPLIRSEVFVRQEWEGILQARVDEIEDGWKSILMMNYGTLDKAGAWKYFAESEQPVPLDDGMTLTWAMFYVASLSSS